MLTILLLCVISQCLVLACHSLEVGSLTAAAPGSPAVTTGAR